MQFLREKRIDTLLYISTNPHIETQKQLNRQIFNLRKTIEEHALEVRDGFEFGVNLDEFSVARPGTMTIIFKDSFDQTTPAWSQVQEIRFKSADKKEIKVTLRPRANNANNLVWQVQTPKHKDIFYSSHPETYDARLTEFPTLVTE